jgi:hypothetical protein
MALVAAERHGLRSLIPHRVGVSGLEDEGSVLARRGILEPDRFERGAFAPWVKPRTSLDTKPERTEIVQARTPHIGIGNLIFTPRLAFDARVQRSRDYGKRQGAITDGFGRANEDGVPAPNGPGQEVHGAPSHRQGSDAPGHEPGVPP